MKVGSLFTGVGGLDLGFIRAGGFEIVWMCEIDPYARKVLALRFPGVPIYEDIRELVVVPAVDVLIGGFPCQDISHAGNKKGIDGEQSGLWREYMRIIRVARPRYVVAYPRQERWEGVLRLDPGLREAVRFGGETEALDFRRPLVPQLEQRLGQPSVFGVNDGLPHRVERLGAVGNAVVPNIAEWVGRQILKREGAAS